MTAWSCTCISRVHLDLSNYILTCSQEFYASECMCWMSYSAGQYQSLRKEAEMLKAGLANSPGGCMRANSEASHAAKTGISEATWQSLGLEKLNLDWEVLKRSTASTHPQGLARFFAVLFFCGRASKELRIRRYLDQWAVFLLPRVLCPCNGRWTGSNIRYGRAYIYHTYTWWHLFFSVTLLLFIVASWISVANRIVLVMAKEL